LAEKQGTLLKKQATSAEKQATALKKQAALTRLAEKRIMKKVIMMQELKSLFPPQQGEPQREPISRVLLITEHTDSVTSLHIGT